MIKSTKTSLQRLVAHHAVSAFANCTGVLVSPSATRFCSAGCALQSVKQKDVCVVLLQRQGTGRNVSVCCQFIAFQMKLQRLLNSTRSSMSITELYWVEIRIMSKMLCKCSKRTSCNPLLSPAALSLSTTAILLPRTGCSLQCSLRC